MRDSRIMTTVEQAANTYDQYDSVENVPERRLLASVLQRALLDLLQMYERTERVKEVKCGEYDNMDEVYEVEHVNPETGRKYKDGFNERWKARTLVRWFQSSDAESPMSFLWILRHLNMEGQREKILHIIENDVLEDHPLLQNMI